MSKSSIGPLLSHARAGSKNALAELLKRYRPLLLTLAKNTIPKQLAGKISPSDAVQETCIDAVRSIEDLRATTEPECRAWLCALLLQNVKDAQRRYVVSKKRRVTLERPLSTGDSRRVTTQLQCDGGTPYEHAVSGEEVQSFEAALARLKKGYRKIIELHSRDRRSFVEIAGALDKSPDAVRMLWNRAIEQLARELRRE